MLFLINLNTFLKVIMDVESVRNYCIKKKRVTESFPFDDETLVFKVFNRMFKHIPLKRNFVSLYFVVPNARKYE